MKTHDKRPGGLRKFLLAYAIAHVMGLVRPFPQNVKTPKINAHAERMATKLVRISDAWAMWKAGWWPLRINRGRNPHADYIGLLLPKK